MDNIILLRFLFRIRPAQPSHKNRQALPLPDNQIIIFANTLNKL
jgi:hypothetical protein